MNSFHDDDLKPLVDALAAPAGPTAALRVRDKALRLQLECVLDRAPETEADVLVIELALGEPAPVYAGARLLVLTDDAAMADNPDLAGVLPCSSSARRIAAAVAAIAEGLTVREVARIWQPARTPANDVLPTGGSRLTPRESEILACVGDGLSNKAIARRLGISAHTVKYHLEAVFAKLAVRSRAEAVTQGVRRGLMTP